TPGLRLRVAPGLFDDLPIGSRRHAQFPARKPLYRDAAVWGDVDGRVQETASLAEQVLDGARLGRRGDERGHGRSTQAEVRDIYDYLRQRTALAEADLQEMAVDHIETIAGPPIPPAQFEELAEHFRGVRIAAGAFDADEAEPPLVKQRGFDHLRQIA